MKTADQTTGTQTSSDAPNGALDSRFTIHDSRASGEAERLTAWAQGWAKSMARWRTVRHRWGAKGKKTLVRVASNPPLECMREILAYLSSAAGAKGLFCDGKAIGDWAPMSAWYEETRAEDGTQAVTVRVFQALRDPADGEADGPFLVQDGCVWKVSHTFYWDVAEVETVPASASGVAYEIQGLRRDEETGLYSYALVRRERVAVEVGPWEAHQDGYQTRERALLLGLRDEEESTVDQKVAAFAQEHTLPLEDGGGKIVDVQKQKNDDCTTDVTVEVTTEESVPGASVTTAEDAFGKRTTTVDRNAAAAVGAPAALGGETRAEQTPGGRYDNTTQVYTPKTVEGAVTEETETLYESESSTTDRNTEASTDAPDGAAPESPASPESPETTPGTITRVREQLTPEGKIDRVTVTRKELAVSEAEKVTAQGALSKTERVTHRNQTADKAAELTAGTPAQGTVRRATVAKTPGNLRDVTLETTTSAAVAAGEAGGSCDTTIFEHRHAEVARNQTSAPDEATVAGGGKTYRVSSRLNEDGTFDTESTVTEELEVEEAQTIAAETAFEKTSTSTDRNADAPAAAPEAPSAANGNALTRAENAKTPGGRYVASVTTTTPKPAQLALTLAKKDGRQVKRLWFRNQSADWVARQAQGYTDGSAQQNDFGLYDGSFQLVLTDKDYEGGDRISIPTHENAFQEVRCNDEVDREQGVIHRVTYTSTVVEGVLNDNADAAYAKCAGSVGPASVNYLGGRTVEQGGRGYYSYRYVQSVTTKTEDIPLSTTDSASGHVMGAGA